MSPWKPGPDGKQGHHPLPKHTQKKTFGNVYDDTTVRVTPEDHQQMHKDIREVGPIGSVARQDIRKFKDKKINKS